MTDQRRPQSPMARLGQFAWYLAAHLSPRYLLAVVFGLVLLALALAFPQRLNRSPMSVRYTMYMVGVFVVMAILWQAWHMAGGSVRNTRRGARLALKTLTDWLPFVLALWIYENLHEFTRWIRPNTVDEQLAAADHWLCGVQPTLWLQQFVHPLLNDYMALAYMTYFVFPPLLGCWLYFRGHVEEFKDFQLALLITFYCGFLGYVIVPAVGPQHILASQYEVPLVGRWFYMSAAQVVTKLQDFPRDCFPSLHTAISSVTLYFYYRNISRTPWRPWVAPIVTVLTVSLWISTVYLRYHWVMDVFAGWLLAPCACASAIFLQRHWPRPPLRLAVAPLRDSEALTP